MKRLLFLLLVWVWFCFVVKAFAYQDCSIYSNSYYQSQLNEYKNACQNASFTSCWPVASSNCIAAKQSVCNTYNNFKLLEGSYNDLYQSCLLSNEQDVTTTTSNSACRNYGLHSYSDGHWYCKCDDGYIFDTIANWDKQCILATNETVCWKHAIISNKKTLSCVCEEWYVRSKHWGEIICTDYNTSCQDRYGSLSVYKSWSVVNWDVSTFACECTPWYILSDNKCISNPKIIDNFLIAGVGSDGLTNGIIDFIYVWTDWYRRIVSVTFNKELCKFSDVKSRLTSVSLWDDSVLNKWDVVTFSWVVSSCSILWVKETWKAWWLSSFTEPSKGVYKSPNLSYENELQTAITWMYTKWLTSFQSVADFNWEWELTREQASKFFVQFAKLILKKESNQSIKVNLNDIKDADITLQPFIIESNQLGLFNGINWYFKPFDNITVAQAMAVLVRAKEWVKNETKLKRYSEYYETLNGLSVLNWLVFKYDELDLVKIKRKEIALMLYRLGNK